MLMIMASAVAGGAIELTLSNSTNWSASTAFGDDWTAGKDKIITIPAGVTIGATGSNPAMTLEASMGGSLVINNSGTIVGYAGAANSGVGGNAIKVLTNSPSTITINNLSGANIQGGGGGGGQGGQGGTGQSGERGFYLGSFCMTSYAIMGGAGGAGGAGGIGAGYNQAAGSGSAGSAGATNSGSYGWGSSNGGQGGTGGTGGDGGALGATGSTGATGATGNASWNTPNGCGQEYAATAGSAGSAGGLAGYYIENLAYVTLNNSGTVAGRS